MHATLTSETVSCDGQAVDHPYLVVHSTTGANGGVGAGSEAQAVKALGIGGGDRGVCAVCHDPAEVTPYYLP